MDIKEILRQLTDSTGVSGYENNAAAVALELLKQYAPDAYIDNSGNVTGIIRAAAPEAKTLMIDAHIDQIGMIVSYITDNGFLKVGACGGLDMRTLLAQSVTIHNTHSLDKNEIHGIVQTLPPHISSDHSKVPDISDISIDVGLSKEQAEKLIEPGDRITVNSCFRELSGNVVSAASIDDRSGVCAILYALDMLKDRKLKYNIAVCFSAQEETGERGVKTAAYRLKPDEAIVVDVSFGRTPDSVPHETAPLGSGVMIGASAILDSEMTRTLKNMAEKSGIPYSMEVMPSSTGTNADSISVSRSGVKCCTLSIPIRYMHTAIETVDISDIESTARLICEYAEGDYND